MLTAKRVIIATACGFVFGLFCMYLASADPAQPISSAMKWSIILSRTLLGFTIGISHLRIVWWLHGMVLGVVCSLPMAVAILPDSKIAGATLMMGLIYGFLTELITARGFKAKGAGRQ